MKEQINKTNDGVKSTRLENLVNAVENVLEHVIKWRDDDLIDVEMSNLKGEESVEQKGQGLKILTLNQMLSDYQFL